MQNTSGLKLGQGYQKKKKKKKKKVKYLPNRRKSIKVENNVYFEQQLQNGILANEVQFWTTANGTEI